MLRGGALPTGHGLPPLRKPACVAVAALFSTLTHGTTSLTATCLAALAPPLAAGSSGRRKAGARSLSPCDDCGKRQLIKKGTDGYRARLEQVARARRSHPQTLNCAARQLTQGPHASTTSASLRWDRPSANGLSGNIGSMLWFDKNLQRTCCPWQRGCPWRRTDADCVAASTFAVEIDSGKSPQGAPKSSLRDQWVRGAIGDELTLRFFEGARRFYFFKNFLVVLKSLCASF